MIAAATVAAFYLAAGVTMLVAYGPCIFLDRANRAWLDHHGRLPSRSDEVGLLFMGVMIWPWILIEIVRVLRRRA